METIEYKRLSIENFSENSLDEFIRYQEMKQSWQKTDDGYELVNREFVYDWNLDECRKTAGKIYSGIIAGNLAYGAFFEGKVVGYIFLGKELFGSCNQYIQLKLFHISQPYRRMGIGKILFQLACESIRESGAKKLYISANPSKESQEAYRKLGCVYAEEINALLAEMEPKDVQMEYVL